MRICGWCLVCAVCCLVRSNIQCQRHTCAFVVAFASHKMYNKTIWICCSADWTIIQCEFIVIFLDTFSRGWFEQVSMYVPRRSERPTAKWFSLPTTTHTYEVLCSGNLERRTDAKQIKKKRTNRVIPGFGTERERDESRGEPYEIL